MRVFAIKDDEQPKDRVLGYLLYFEKAKSFYIELPDSADPWDTPLLLSSLLARGEHTVNAYLSGLWVQQRIIPPDRQNLGQVLKENGLTEYDEFALLMLGHGRCAQDAYYLEEVDALPQEILDRWKTKVEDVVPLGEKRLLVFFRDDVVKICSIAKLAASDSSLAPVIHNDDVFRTVRVQTDGYGVSWGERLCVANEQLYRSGEPVPLTLDDFRSFIADRVVNTAEAQEMLGCTRQNINDLIRRGKLHPIREDAKNKLYLKNEIQQRIQK